MVEPFCTASTLGAIDPGGCETLDGDWSPAPAELRTLTAAVDVGGDQVECRDGNNTAILEDVGCP